MSTAVNFSSLQLTTTAASTDRLLLRNSSSLSGSAGFNQISVGNIERALTVYSTVNAQSANNTSVYSTVNAQSGNWSVFTGTVSAATFISSVNSSSVANYQFALLDATKTTIDTYSTNAYYGVPSNTVVTFPIGSQLIIVQGNKTSSNYTILSAGAGVTINSFSNSLSLAGNYAAGTLIKTDTNTWYLIGNLK